METQPRQIGRGIGILLLFAALNCVVQFVWFWRFVHRNINYDAISYIGIARHLVDGNFRQSLHGYWSPLISWIIALLSVFSLDFTYIARLVTITSFLVCLPLLYLLTLRLWKSPLLAATSVLWFTLARGVVAFSVSFIGADFLLTALTLIYFILLLRAIGAPTTKNWLLLGIPHALAFLAKAFAMPWLVVSTLAAITFSHRSRWKQSMPHAALALLIPAMFWMGWAGLLRAKYGVFTSGYQSKWNLLDAQLQQSADRGDSRLSIFADTSRTYDSYMVVDNMYPASPLWQTKVRVAKVLSQVLSKEATNLPSALKEILILLTPGGVLALILVLAQLRKERATAESRFIATVLTSSVFLLLGYCMLVFDHRYVLPIIPLLIAVAVRGIVPANFLAADLAFFSARTLALLLLIAGTLYVQLYAASPFRSVRRDYELSAYDAAFKLRAIPSCNRLAVVGSGPYQEHGFGWEAGIYASYFAQCRMVAFRPQLPRLEQLTAVERELAAINPDAILLLGAPANSNYNAASEMIGYLPEHYFAQRIIDSNAGEVGTLLWRSAEDFETAKIQQENAKAR